jgi:hypothetical protein
MARVALACSVLALATLAAAGWGMFAAVGLGLFAAGLGLAAYRQRSAPPVARLAGASATALGVVALLIGSAKVALSIAAVQALARLAG